MAEQSLGEALQEVHSTVNEVLGTQDASVTFRTHTATAAAHFGLPDTAASNSDVGIDTGLKIGRATTRDIIPGGKVKENDLRLEVPASLLTEAQLENSEILYNDNVYTLVTYGPMEIFSGIVVRWKVFGRLKKS